MGEGYFYPLVLFNWNFSAEFSSKLFKIFWNCILIKRLRLAKKGNWLPCWSQLLPLCQRTVSLRDASPLGSFLDTRSSLPMLLNDGAKDGHFFIFAKPVPNRVKWVVGNSAEMKMYQSRWNSHPLNFVQPQISLVAFAKLYIPSSIQT